MATTSSSGHKLEDFEIGQTVRVINPTGGIRPDDPFEVAEVDKTLVYVLYKGEPRWIQSWTTKGDKMGFDPGSLEHFDAPRKIVMHRSLITVKVIQPPEMEDYAFDQFMEIHYGAVADRCDAARETIKNALTEVGGPLEHYEVEVTIT